MLCRAEFLPINSGEAQQGSSFTHPSTRLALFVPETAIIESSDTTFVWALDSSGKHLERRIIRTASEQRDGHIRVIDGLRPGDFVANNSPVDLKSGERAKPPIIEP